MVLLIHMFYTSTFGMALKDDFLLKVESLNSTVLFAMSSVLYVNQSAMAIKALSKCTCYFTLTPPPNMLNCNNVHKNVA